MSTKLGKSPVGGVAYQRVLAGEMRGNVCGEFSFTLEGGGNNGFDDSPRLVCFELFFKEVIRRWPRLSGSAAINGDVAKCAGDKWHDGIIGGG